MRTLLFVILLGLCQVASSQNPVLVKNGVFKTFVTDSRGNERPITFSINKKLSEQIRSSEVYRSFWADGPEQTNVTDSLAVFLESKVRAADAATRQQLGYNSSFEYFDQNRGDFDIDKKGNFSVTLPTLVEVSPNTFRQGKSITTGASTEIRQDGGTLRRSWR